MKKLGLFILGLFTVFFIGNFTHANDYEYTNLSISAHILEDGTVNVTEKYTADFFVSKHGIIRTIPLNYTVAGNQFHIDISDVNVEGKTFTTNTSNGQVSIKIGDADKTIIGEQIYLISYTTYGLIKNFSGMGYSELYWNLVGNEFDTNINKVKSVIYLPKIYTGFTSDDFLITVDGSKTSVYDFQGRFDRSHGDRIIITYDEGLNAYEGITLAIKFPNGYFEFDHDKQSGLLGVADDEYGNNDKYDNPIIAENISSDSVKNSSHETEVDDNLDYIYSNSVVTTDSSNHDSELDKKEPTKKKQIYSNSEYKYTNLDIIAEIQNDGTIDVYENYTANFSVQKHGIIRTIPLNYTVSNYAFHIDVSNINVAGKTFKTSKENGIIDIKIGDADRTVIGEQSYPISYTTYGLIRNFSGLGYSELYWNLVGYDFDTSIDKVKAEIDLPKPYTGFTSDSFLITTDGKSKTVEDFEGTIDWSQGDKIIITYDEGLSYYNGITLTVFFPNGYFEFDHDKQAKLVGHVKTSSFKIDREAIGAALSPFAMIALFIFAFTRKGKDIKNKIDRKSGKLKGDFAKQFPVIVQYEPPKGLNSAEVGLLLHRGAQAKDMLSLIYKWAVEGLISLSADENEGSFFKKSSKNIIITKNRDISGELPGYEQDLFRALVRSEKNKISETSNLYSKLGLSGLEKYGEKKGWFTIKKIGKLFPILFLGIFFIAPILGGISPMLARYSVLGFFFLVIGLSGGARFKETEEGARLISHILGYKEFLAACDENKLRAFLEEDPLYFDKVLPYAVVFGLDTELIKKMEPIMKEMNIKSTLYNGDLNYINIINNTVSSAATHSVPPSASYSSDGGFSGGSSSGGGFSSGGGGGGGGGRSW